VDYRRETIETWASDFADTDAYRALPAPAQEYAARILPAFLLRACEERDVSPDGIEAADLKPALLEGVAPLALPGSVRAAVPELCAAFLETLQQQGRLADGRTLGLTVKALRGPFEQRATDKPAPFRRPGSPLGRNDPCPCGSGKKYKRCCGRPGGAR